MSIEWITILMFGSLFFLLGLGLLACRAASAARSTSGIE